MRLRPLRGKAYGVKEGGRTTSSYPLRKCFRLLVACVEIEGDGVGFREVVLEVGGDGCAFSRELRVGVLVLGCRTGDEALKAQLLEVGCSPSQFGRLVGWSSCYNRRFIIIWWTTHRYVMIRSRE